MSLIVNIFEVARLERRARHPVAEELSADLLPYLVHKRTCAAHRSVIGRGRGWRAGDGAQCDCGLAGFVGGGSR